MKKKLGFLLKSKKKFVLLLITIISAISCFAIVMAGDTASLTVSKVESASQGDTVTLTVDFDNVNNEEYTTFAFFVTYDPEMLSVTKNSYVSVSDDITDAFEMLVVTVDKDDDGNETGIIMFAATKNEGSGITTDGNILTIKFDVTDNASGQQDVEVNNVDIGYFADEDDTKVNVATEVENGYVFVDVPVENVELEQTNFTLDTSTNDTDKINITYSPENTTTAKNYSFISNDTDVVTVDEDGTLHAVGNGNTTIKVNAFGQEFEANVEVITSITSIALDKTSLSMSKGETADINAKVNPSTTSMDKTLTYSSSNTNVATVDENGKVTAISNGTATITITSVNNVVATCEVKVVVPITDATISDSQLSLNKGESEKLTVTIEPSDATDQDITWTSSDENVAIVDGNGNVTAVGAGKATITASVGNYELTTSVEVEVPITSFELSDTSVELLPTQTQKITYTITPSDFTGDDTITWTSSNNDIATVKDGVITAVASGSTTISATIQGITKQVNVKVLIPIDNFTISESTKTMNRGDSSQLIVTITPADAEEDKTVTWESSNSSVVSVDEYGNIKAISGGVATITGTLANGATVECVVTVEVGVDKFTVDQSNVSINKGESKTITATITPSDVTYPEITWKSNDETIATVDETDDGVAKITAVGAGTTTITGTLKTGETVSVSVTVTVPIKSITITGDELKNNSLTLNKSVGTKLNVTINPTDTTEDTTITWKSSDESVATVDSSGYVTAISGGKATISATVGSVTDEVDVNVVVPITSIEITGTSNTLVKNKTLTLKATINPTDTTEDTTVTWKSSDISIATVDENGVVTGISAGSATITATLANGMSETYDITVEIIPINSISFADENITLNKNETKKLNINIDPVDTTEADTITYTSSDESVVTVSEDGTITGIGEGTATITAKIGEFTATTDVTINEVHLESLSIANDLTNISVGDILDIQLVLNPTDTTDELTFTYTSSDSSIVSIDEQGHLIAISKGTATITVTASNGVEVSYTINVSGEESPNTGVESAGKFGILSILFLGATVVTAKKIRE